MAGITSSAYREFYASFGVGYVVTEMVSDMGLIYGNKETKSYVTFERLDIPTGVQLFGNSAENLAKAALICEKMNPNIDFYDVNMGCPVPKVTKTGAGSSLMNNPKLCGDIVRAIKEATHKPVTVKIRLGSGNNKAQFKEVIKEVIAAGVDLIAIHPRSAKEMYGGQPHWELVKDLKKNVNVPLIVSGNIYTVEDAVRAMEITGADGVMVARGGVGNPLLVSNINNYFNNKELFTNNLDQQIGFCLELARLFIEEKGENVAMRTYRGIATKFFDGFPKSKQLKCRLSTELNTYSDFLRIIEEYKKEIEI
ncbi:MAG: tRNA-dihydrouridine synthase family protein [Bacilli bacterium]|nr:tRNA-dihydrouridine synthase family protein [Bacilli bacterium]